MIVRRDHFKEGLHPVYVPFYDALCLALSDDWQPICGLRSFEVQDLLYAQGRTVPGKILTKAAPGLSFHQYGLASDWDYFPNGKYTSLPFEDTRWQEYINACEKTGLRLISWEKPHNELNTKCSARELLAAYNNGGMASVDHLLRGEQNE